MNRVTPMLLLSMLVLLQSSCNTIRDEQTPATNHITLSVREFTPETLQVSPGDLVTWINRSSVRHVVTSGVGGVPDRIWDSGSLAPGDSYGRVFSSVGSFPYFCPLCRAEGMTGQIEVRNTGVYKVESLDVFVLRWLPRADSNLVHIEVSAPTGGWVAVGFNAVPKMAGANLIIGYVARDTTHVLDSYGPGRWVHVADVDSGGTDDVRAVSGSEAAGRTEIQFTIPLDSGDRRDLPLAVGQSFSLLMSYGTSDDFTTIHSRFVYGTIRI